MRSRFFITSVVLSLLLGCATAPKPRSKAAVPPTTPISRLDQAIIEYKMIASKKGWPILSGDAPVRPEDRGERVLVLRKRLAITKDIPKFVKKDVFDEELLDGVKSFQERHGLTPDGVIGKETLRALKVPVEERIRQLEANRHMKQELPSGHEEKYIIINIPDFRLKVMEREKPALSMKVVVGQPEKWQTPPLSSRIGYLILNPKWNVPPGIFEKELIHELRKDPAYLEKHNMKVVAMGENAGDVLDPATIDWKAVSAKSPQLRIVQVEGNGNSLGRIKFMFHNPYSIYLHDTPDKKFFLREMRALSHGCVRVEKPIELATYLLKENPSWSQKKIVSAIQEGKNRDVSLPSPIPLYIIYRTAWVDEQGSVQFRNDIYHREFAL